MSIQLSDKAPARVKQFDFDFAELAIKGKGSMGNIVTKQPIKKITQKTLGDSTLGGREMFFDSVVGRLNTAGHGRYLGTFDTDNTVLVVFKDGSYELTPPDPALHYDVPNIVLLRKFEPEVAVSTVYVEGETKVYYVKRFKIETSTLSKRFTFISETKGSKMLAVTANPEPLVEVKVQRDKKADKETEKIALHEFIDVKGWKAMGNKLNFYKIPGLALLTDEGPEPQRREVAKKRVAAAPAKPGEGEAGAAAGRAEASHPVDITAEEVAQARELLKRPKAQLGLF